AIILLGRRDDARVLLRVEERFAVLREIGKPIPQKIDQGFGYRLLAYGETTRQRHASILRGLSTERCQTAIAMARNPGSLGVDAVEIGEDRLDGRGQAVNVESIESGALVRIRDRLVYRLQALQEIGDLSVPPHPSGKPGEGCFGNGRR